MPRIKCRHLTRMHPPPKATIVWRSEQQTIMIALVRLCYVSASSTSIKLLYSTRVTHRCKPILSGSVSCAHFWRALNSCGGYIQGRRIDYSSHAWTSTLQCSDTTMPNCREEKRTLYPLICGMLCYAASMHAYSTCCLVLSSGSTYAHSLCLLPCSQSSSHITTPVSRGEKETKDKSRIRPFPGRSLTVRPTRLFS